MKVYRYLEMYPNDEAAIELFFDELKHINEITTHKEQKLENGWIVAIFDKGRRIEVDCFKEESEKEKIYKLYQNTGKNHFI